MKFLLDVCVCSRKLADFLNESGHDVLLATSVAATASDTYLLELSRSEGRILVTQDKDFGELVFVKGHPHGTIVRLIDQSVSEQVDAMKELLKDHASILVGPTLVTASAGRIRVRSRLEGQS